jgi:hypothetical protein
MTTGMILNLGVEIFWSVFLAWIGYITEKTDAPKWMYRLSYFFSGVGFGIFIIVLILLLDGTIEG